MDAEKHYEEVKDLFYFVIDRFICTHGGDREELLSICHEGYIIACQNYDPTKTKFATWVYNNLWWKMLTHDRNEKKRVRHFEEADFTFIEQKHYSKPLAELYDVLTDDAKCVCEVLLDLSPEFLQSFRDSGQFVRKIRRAIRQLFLDIGWPRYRIRLAFRDLRMGLSK